MNRAATITTICNDQIDPKLIPDFEWDRACAVLVSGINRALADPERRADYELFRTNREEWNRKHMN